VQKVKTFIDPNQMICFLCFFRIFKERFLEPKSS
jgi:hypothetical protein